MHPLPLMRGMPLARLTRVQQPQEVPRLIRLPLHLVPTGCPEEVETSEEVAELWRAAVAALDRTTASMPGHYLHDAVRLACEQHGVAPDASLARESFSHPAQLSMATRMLASPGWLDDREDSNLWTAFQVAFVLLVRIEGIGKAGSPND